MTNLTDQQTQTPDPVDVQGSLQQVGSQLQSARAEQKLGLEEVAERLRLAPGIVSAIEGGASEQLPAMTFVRGYIRSYARLLNIDEQALLSQLGDASHQINRPLSVNTSIRYRRPAKMPSGKWIVWLLLLCGVAALVMFAYPVIERLLFSKEREVDTPQLELPHLGNQIDIVPLSASKQPAQTETVKAPEPADVVDEPVSMPSPPAVAANNSATQKQQTSARIIELKLVATADSWVEVSAQGEKLVTGIMQAGSSERIKASPPFDILIGNGPAVAIEYDGVPFDITPFMRGKVARFTLNN